MLKESSHIKITDAGINNLISIGINPQMGYINILITGNNNRIIIDDASNIKGSLNINVHANSSSFEIGKVYIGQYLNVELGHDFMVGKLPENIFIKVNSKNTLACFEGCTIESLNSNSIINIDEGVMVSMDTLISNSDHHPIYDLKTHQIINHPTKLTFGKHVWLGRSASILKNVHLSDNVIVGHGCVCAKSFVESNIAIAGNPAKIIKRNITWDYRDINFV